ncbi:MAG: PAS domain-containing protein [Chloroflexia bacterium]|nr:PAS domain-containing protein [Chloroflexia bacterium]
MGNFSSSNGKLVYCSPSVEKVIGYTQEEYLNGVSFSSMVHPDDMVEFTEFFNYGLAGKFIPSCKVRLLHKNGTIKWVDSEMRPVMSETGELLGTRYSIWDITKLKETELALYENRELLNLALESFQDWFLRFRLSR